MTGAASRRLRTTVEMGLREHARTPVLVVLLFALPAYFVGVFVFVLPSSTLPVSVTGSGRVAVETVALYGVLVVPTVAGLVGGLAGLFATLSAREADVRLVAAGARPAELVVARYALVAVVGLVATAVSLAVLSVAVVPERPAWFVAASVLAALSYGLLGAVAGLAAGRLTGVYLALFVPMVDVLFFQNPVVEEGHWLAQYLPGHHATALAVDAGLSESVAVPTAGWAVAYLAVVAVVATAAVYRSVG